ncbi:MAG: 2Fe-2S iron-sulfur cluster binding domain-containing protein [Deltaproteobacteria bacterium]|nr:2Fe-2S iron-sulfur cluster binding domain-containing protein [Deltaproteobacteria bacterium]
MPFKIEFKKTGKTFEWDTRFGNILEFAEAKGIQIDNACRVGVCGTCKVKLLSGKVAMDTEDGLQEEDRAENMILPCVAVPETDIVIEV